MAQEISLFSPDIKMFIEISKIVIPFITSCAIVYIGWSSSWTARQTLFEKVHNRLKELLKVASLENDKVRQKAILITKNTLKGWHLKKQRELICELYGFNYDEVTLKSPFVTKNTLLICFLLISLGGSVWYFLNKNEFASNSEAFSPQKISLTTSKNLWCTLPILAKARGFFKEEGLNVNVQYVQAAKLAMDALVSEQSDISTVVDINIAYLGYTGNKNVNLIGTIVHAYDGAIVARKDSGITKPEDLKGKQLGILQGTTSQIFADNFLKAHNISSSDIVLRNLSPISIQSALVDGKLDAGSLWEPFIHNISSRLNDNAIVFKDPNSYTGYMNLAVRKDWKEQNNVAIKAFLKSIRKAEQFIRDNPKEAKLIMAKAINLDIGIVEAIWDQYKFSLELDENQLIDQIVQEGNWINSTQSAFKDKLVPQFYDQYIDTSYLSAIQ